MRRQYIRNFVTLKQERTDYTIKDREAFGTCVIEIRGQSVKLSSTISHLKSEYQYKLCLIAVKEDTALCVSPTNFKKLGSNIMEARCELDADNVYETGLPIEAFNVVLAATGAVGADIIAPLCGYTDKPILWRSKVVSFDKDSDREKVNIMAYRKDEPVISKPETYVTSEKPETHSTADRTETYATSEKPETHSTSDRTETYSAAGKPETYPTVDKPETHPIVNKPEIYTTDDETERYSTAESKQPNIVIFPDSNHEDDSILEPKNPKTSQNFETNLIDAAQSQVVSQIIKNYESGEYDECGNEYGNEYNRGSELNFEDAAITSISTENDHDKPVQYGNLEKFELDELPKENEISAEETEYFENITPEINDEQTEFPDDNKLLYRNESIKADEPYEPYEITESPVPDDTLSTKDIETTEDSEDSEFKKLGSEIGYHEAFKLMARKFNDELKELAEYASITEDGKDSKDSKDSEGSEDTRIELDRIFRENIMMQPFLEQKKEVSWVRIGLDELSALPIDSDKYASSEFVTTRYYKYRHLLLGRLKAPTDQKEFVLGVPDMYESKYKIIANELKFMQFKPCESRSLIDGIYGYWLMLI